MHADLVAGRPSSRWRPRTEPRLCASRTRHRGNTATHVTTPDCKAHRGSVTPPPARRRLHISGTTTGASWIAPASARWRTTAADADRASVAGAPIDKANRAPRTAWPTSLSTSVASPATRPATATAEPRDMGPSSADQHHSSTHECLRDVGAGRPVAGRVDASAGGALRAQSTRSDRPLDLARARSPANVRAAGTAYRDPIAHRAASAGVLCGAAATIQSIVVQGALVGLVRRQRPRGGENGRGCACSGDVQPFSGARGGRCRGTERTSMSSASNRRARRAPDADRPVASSTARPS